MNGDRGLMAVAPAKINWTLEVLGRRADGFHEIRSVMQTISLVDYVWLRPAPRLSLTVEGLGAASLATDDNLVLRAARAFPRRLAREPVAFRLLKHIPEAAGLGGGSSDAAAALRLLCRYWRLADAEAVSETAASLGADVSFFLRGGIQAASGRGERLTRFAFPSPLRRTAQREIVLLQPAITLSQKTARLYARITPAHYTGGEATSALAQRCAVGAAPTATDYVNVFDRVADEVYPDLSRYRRMLERATGARAMLAGAGPTLFALVPDMDTALEAKRRLAAQGAEAWAEVTTNLVSDPCGS